jgi:hypothetical protein
VIAAGLPSMVGTGSARWVPSANQTYARSLSIVPTVVPSSSMSAAVAPDVPAGTGSRIGFAVTDGQTSAWPASSSPTIAPASLIAEADPRRTPCSFTTLPPSYAYGTGPMSPSPPAKLQPTAVPFELTSRSASSRSPGSITFRGVPLCQMTAW